MTPQFDEAVAAFERGELDRARALAEQELSVSANAAEVEYLLGLIDCRSERIDSGVEWLRRALGRAPGNDSYRVMLARALIDSGRAAEALETAVPPSGTSPPELALWHARAEAAAAIRAWDKSAEAWRALCVGAEREWRAWAGYANALGELGRWGEASSAFNRAVDLNPRELPLRRCLAAALARAGQYDRGAREFERCVEAAPTDLQIRISFARLLADLGRQEESLVQLRKAAELATGSGEASKDAAGLLAIARGGVAGGRVDLDVLSDLAHLLERSDQDLLGEFLNTAEREGIPREKLGYPAAAAALRDGDAEAAKLLLLADDPGIDPVRWHWLMGRIEDALGDSAAAFAEAEAMNRSTADFQAWRQRGVQHLQWARGVASLLTPEWASELPVLEPGERRTPAFLVGFPRSGTTLLDTFLMGHPDTAVLEEAPLIAAVEATLGDIALLPQRSTAELEKARGAYFAELDRRVEPGFGGLVIDKYPLNMVATPYIRALFPDAKIIFAQRHPCDAVLSCFMQAFVLNNGMACFLDIRNAAAFYDAAMSVWTRSCDVLSLKAHTLVYERLVADPEPELRPLIDFLGLDWRPELLDHRATAKKRGVVSTPSYDQVIRPLSRAPSGRWRRYEKQLQPVLPLLLRWAERLGYTA